MYLRRDGVGVYCCGKEGYYFKPKKEKLRLLVTPECHRGCAGCCNKDWNLNDLPVCNSFHGYNEIIITGGEPMLLGVERLIDLTRSIRRVNKGTKIFMYTSFVESPLMIAELFYHLEGITLTIHEKDDVDKLESFFYLYKFCRRRDFLGKMFMRLNVFKGIDYSSLPGLELWKVKDNITWQKNCPLPEGEVFMRLGSE